MITLYPTCNDDGYPDYVSADGMHLLKFRKEFGLSFQWAFSTLIDGMYVVQHEGQYRHVVAKSMGARICYA